MNIKNKRTPKKLKEIFKIPIWIGVVTLGGLFSALIGDDFFDIFSWAALSVPVILMGHHLWRGFSCRDADR